MRLLKKGKSMRIKWEIKKKRGNFRPSLNYVIVLEPFEKKLAVHAVSVQSTIPMVCDPHLSFCLPGENERELSWEPSGFHVLSAPFFKNGRISEFIRLPFRASGEYPEVEASFEKLRKNHERVVQKAYRLAPINTQGNLDICHETKKQIAAMVTADRFMDLYGKNNRTKTA